MVRAGKYNGLGTQISSGSNPYTYEGMFINGVQQGQGKVTLSNGDVYEGAWDGG